MHKHEAKFTTPFLQWFKTYATRPAALEIKHTRGANTFRLAELKEHQRNALRASKHGKWTYKIPDTGFTNPFDAVFFIGMDAYVVVAYPSCFVGIDIDRVPLSGSIAETDAKKIAAFVGQLPFQKK